MWHPYMVLLMPDGLVEGDVCGCYGGCAFDGCDDGSDGRMIWWMEKNVALSW